MTSSQEKDEQQQLETLYLAVTEELTEGKDPSILIRELVEAGMDPESAKYLVNDAKEQIDQISFWDSFLFLFHLRNPLLWIGGIMTTLTCCAVANLILNLVLNLIAPILALIPYFGGFLTKFADKGLGEGATVVVSFFIWNAVKDSKSDSFSSGMLLGIVLYTCWLVYELIIKSFLWHMLSGK